ncbi:MAG: toxin-antitoxin system YwqK family antitoxin [Fusobacteriaceae bacterium]|jgi:antitoxin component YwqK of YwqJK toxin-antitoxin module|nr:toxin-antitoxin system YwqK family antitoxin [Fusobacteriaceae bacterium]
MKKILIAIMLCAAALCAKVVNSGDLEKRNGLWYETKQTKPFSGTARAFYEGGQTRTELSFVEGVPEGPSKGYFPDGKLRSEGNFAQDKKTGVWKHYFENGNVQIVEEYSGDSCVVREYYESGILSMERVIKDGKLNGPLKWYYETGKPQGECNFTDDLQDGVETKYYEDGVTKKSEYAWVKGVITGRGAEYYPGGALRIEAQYKDDKKDGLYREFFEGGGLLGEVNFAGDKREGLLKQYDAAGKLILEVPYKDDLKEGLMKEYFPTGQVKTEAAFSKDLLNGFVKEYDEKGNVITTVEFRDNEPLVK